MADKPIVHITDMNSFLVCRVLWHYTSPLRMNLEPVMPNKHLVLGTCVDEALNAYYGQIDGPNPQAMHLEYEHQLKVHRKRIEDDVFDVPTGVEEYFDLGRRMLDHYEVWAPHHDQAWEILGVQVPIRDEWPDCTQKGTADMLVRKPDGTVWIVETKTFGQIPSPVTLGFGLQPVSYVRAARRDPEIAQHGEVKGLIYNILRKYKCATPSITKQQGRLERRANIVCTPEMYTEIVRRNNFPLEQYADFISGLDSWKLNARVEIEVTDARIKVFESTFQLIARQMLDRQVPIYPCNPMRQCDGCAFSTLCALALNGADWQGAIGLEFRERRGVRDLEAEE